MISLLFILFNLLLVFFFPSNKAFTHPEPKIWICEGHILFPSFLPKQQFLEYNWEQQLQPYQGII
ncbi:unnamed protein product [Meloidogyne enterolobii]|uniref:Uncharacterized protein n=1 Tax=Meloidogyne enterolobii TaxID=390850 RepID=A0ACB0ZYV7_MELEN